MRPIIQEIPLPSGRAIPGALTPIVSRSAVANKHLIDQTAYRTLPTVGRVIGIELFARLLVALLVNQNGFDARATDVNSQVYGHKLIRCIKKGPGRH